jgi:hypothetical protein
MFRVSRIFRGIGTLAHSWGLRDDGMHGHRGGGSTYDPAAPGQEEGTRGDTHPRWGIAGGTFS